MGITSLAFPVFLTAFLVLFFALSRTGLQIYAVLAASILYMTVSTGAASTLLAMLLSLCLWLIGRRMQRADTSPRTAQLLMWLGLVLDLGLLLYFKFFSGIFEGLFMASAAPLGLSYFSLSAAAYIVDCRKKKVEAAANYLHFLTYVTFFPALHQGPFNLYKDLMPQLETRHRFHEARFISGLQRILWGYFKKMVIADRLNIFVSGAIADTAASGIVVFFTMILYSFQIYTDFSGGIDIIMGLTEIMGIELPENFRSPLCASSVAEFWKRWHITLGTIMEKYIYYPLVLSKRMRSISKLIRNKYLSRVFSAAIANFLVFILVGIWHGTGWNYVVYGLYQAFFTTSSILLAPVYKKIRSALKLGDTAGYHVFASLRTFGILVFGRYFTRAGSLSLAFDLLRRTFCGGAASWNPRVLFDGTITGYGLEYKNLILALICIVLIITIDILHEKGLRLRQAIMAKPFALRLVIYYLALFGIIVFGIYGKEYSASAFIYAQF